MVHEWAFAESIVLYVLSKSVKKTRRLLIKIGALQSLDKEILRFAINELARENEIEIGEVEILEEEPLLKCNNCGYTWTIKVSNIEEQIRESIHFIPEAIYAYYNCPKCGSIDYEIKQGRGFIEVLVENHE